MRLLAALTTAAWLATGFSAMAQQSTVSTEEARRLGLEVAWQSQVQMPRTKGIASTHLWAESTGARQYALAEVNGRTVQVSADKLDRSGNTIGLESAKLQAQQEAQFHSFDTNGDGVWVPAEVTALGQAFAKIDRDQDGKISFAEHIRFIDWNTLIGVTLGKNGAAKMLKERGLEAAVQLVTAPTGIAVKEITIPRIKLAVVSQNGSVQTFDAETGKMLWANTCGDSTAPAFPAAVSKAGVVVLHGDRLYVLDWETGKLVTSKPLRYASSNAVAVTDNIAFVSDFSGRVEVYVIGESDYKQSWGYVIRGRAIGDTVKMHGRDLCGIASADGFFYVFSAVSTPDVWMRYKSTTPIGNCVGTGNNAFYVGNDGGRLSKIVIDDRIGRTAWNFLGVQSFSSAPLVVGKHLFVPTDDGTLYCINDSDGTEAWISRSMAIREPLAVAGDVVYGRSQAAEIVGFDVATGKVVGRAVAKNLGKALMNQLTDRVYLVGNHGQIQCLRPIGSEVPKLVTPVVLEEKPTQESAPTTPAENANPTNESSPFESSPPAGTDPFSSPDPFGAAPGEEPKQPAMDDPFAP